MHFWGALDPGIGPGINLHRRARTQRDGRDGCFQVEFFAVREIHGSLHHDCKLSEVHTGRKNGGESVPFDINFITGTMRSYELPSKYL